MLEPLNFPEDIQSVKGCSISETDQDDVESAAALASVSDVVILFVGIDQSLETEEKDRYETTLPGLQPKLVQSVLNVANEKTIIVLIHGGSMSLGDDTLKNAAAIISAGYGGQAGSQAIASVLFGHYDPTGKLSATWYPPSYVNDIPLTEMGLRVGVGRTYMYYTGKPEFSFGHGLSYNSWKLEWSDQTHKEESPGSLTLSETESVRFQVTITNLGAKRHSNRTISSSSQNILVFWRPGSDITIGQSASGSNQIQQKLIAFQQTTKPLKVGESEVLEFEVTWNDFSLWNSSMGSSVSVSGKYELLIQTSDNTHLTRSLELIPSSSRNNDDNVKDKTMEKTATVMGELW